jgi:hypothetical protein
VPVRRWCDMESPSEQFPPIPRLRVTRHYMHEDDGVSNFPPARPPRLPIAISLNDDPEKIDDDDDPDAQSTPKMSLISSISPSNSPPIAAAADTPAARLRALLSRVPNNSTPKLSTQDRPPAPPSELDSDFDPPRPSPTTPSIARESLKDLFSRALREPGDTPQRARRRRNSIDTSEVEASPRVERERAKNKGKRRSLSDEEVEKPSSK